MQWDTDRQADTQISAIALAFAIAGRDWRG